ncbi:succinate dehydrogenase cytochrome b subunit [Nocardioides sp. KC13]|uniref:Succinate dehydrogenase cytochrome b subunit n=1 Tax=Nocardioides turkmenicus TaxID=2711220 RepID=A0A6M1QVT8_9ACTN|nr:succinate dehydrogenase cytochrome b subunit [Nocardioides sp. KC13]
MATTTLIKGARSTRSTIALKLLMAASGIVFILFVLVHMYGNLKAFSGELAFNEYAEHLRTFGEPMLPYGGLLWIIRVVLLASLVAHVGSAIALAKRAHAQRPVKYSVKKNKASSLSSRTMRWGGVALFLFVVWHLLQFTIVKINVGAGGQAPEVTENPYRLLISAFQPEQWWMVIIYLLAMLALAFHLHHGTFSAIQTLGFTNTAESRARARVAGWVVAIVVAGGFSLVPLFTVFGVIS